MPMPEMPDRLKAIMETKSDQLNELVNYDRGNCYAAGKADGRYELLKCDGRFPTIHLIDLEDGNGTQEFVTLKDTEQWGFVCKESAGKADALPPWPPPYKEFKFKSGVIGGTTVLWRVPEFDRLSDKPCWCEPVRLSDGLSVAWEKVSRNGFRGDDVTAAYFRGELEEVK